jgi:hypothetical protein
MSMKCLWCGSRKMQLSHLQVFDLTHLFRLRYPVRCHICYERNHVSFTRAWDLHSLERSRRASKSRPKSLPGHATHLRQPIS